MLLLNRDKNSGGWGDDRRIHLTSKFTSKVYPTIKKKKNQANYFERQDNAETLNCLTAPF